MHIPFILDDVLIFGKTENKIFTPTLLLRPTHAMLSASYQVLLLLLVQTMQSIHKRQRVEVDWVRCDKDLTLFPRAGEALHAEFNHVLVHDLLLLG